MIARLRPRRRRDDGASAVELALVLPILLALVFGIISFGTLFAQQLALNNGVRQGARLAVVEGSDAGQKSCAGVVSAVRDSTGPSHCHGYIDHRRAGRADRHPQVRAVPG